MSTSSRAPVLIVGAGPTGLMLACELARRDVAVRIIDRLAEPAPFARATGVHARTLEIFQDHGIAESLIEQAAIVRGTRQFAGKDCFMHLRYDGLETPYPFALSVEQWRVEQALQSLLNDYGVSIERGTEFLDLTMGLDSVRASLRNPAGAEDIIEAAWLVACDGAHSTVRHVLGEAFPGEEDPRLYLIADVTLDDGSELDEVHVHLADDGVVWRFPLPDGRTLLAADAPTADDAASVPPTLEQLQVLLDRRLPAVPYATDPRWLSWFHIHYRLTPHYRHGRVFLAGDAAHIHSPIGGQGMNTGIQDAYNLGWKLAAAWRGHAPTGLLDSYEIERRAVAEDVLATTRALTEQAEQYVTMTPAQKAQASRHLSLPDAQRLGKLRHGEELDLDYRRSPICHDGTTTGSSSPGPHAGSQAPDAGDLEVGGEPTSLYELLRGTRHTLLLLSGRDERDDHDWAMWAMWAKRHDKDFRVLLVTPDSGAVTGKRIDPALRVVDRDGQLHARYAGDAPWLFAIRPDGHVGLRCEAGDRQALEHYLDRVLAKR